LFLLQNILGRRVPADTFELNQLSQSALFIPFAYALLFFVRAEIAFAEEEEEDEFEEDFLITEITEEEEDEPI